MLKKYSSYFTLLLLLLICSCVKNPLDTPQKFRSAIYQYDSSATHVLLGIYAKMVDGFASGHRIALYTSLASDELSLFTSAELSDIYKNHLLADNIYTYWLWTDAYSCIYMANDVIDGCSLSIGLSPHIKAQLTAEALFIRAYYHFYLVNLFGPIPMVISIEVAQNSKLTRSNADEVYAQVVSDLQRAQSMLSESYTDANNQTGSVERTRVNKAAATALLARVYLYWGKYHEAEKQATAVIVNHTYGLVSLDDIFLKNSMEAIWQLMPSTPNQFSINTHEGLEYILQNSPQKTLQAVLSPLLVNTFSDEDLRKKHWIGKYIDSVSNPEKHQYFHYAHKYKIALSSQIKEYAVVFRLAEQYLIRAEAFAQQGDVQEAIADLDKIRKRAGLKSIALTQPNITPEALLDSVAYERRRELFTEGGHRWLDLKRTGKINVVMNSVLLSKSGQWNQYMEYWPIPLQEIKLNHNLTQNQGY